MKAKGLVYALLMLLSTSLLAETSVSVPPTAHTLSASSVPEFLINNAFVYECPAVFQWLDPHVSYHPFDFWILQQSLETLLWYNGSSSTELVPWLAESYKRTSDTQYEFKLRAGITFQDGTPFNSTAVWFSFNRLLIMDGTSGGDPEFSHHGSQAAWIVQQLADTSLSAYFSGPQLYDSAWVRAVLDQNFVEIIDAYSVRFNLKNPLHLQFPYLLSGPWASVISPASVIAVDFAYHNWGQWDGNYTKYFEHMAGVGDTYFNLPEQGWRIGTGPYYVESVDPATYGTILKANEAYWGGPQDLQYRTGVPKIKEMDVNYVESFATRLLDLQSGKATGIMVRPADLYAVVDRDKWLQEGIFQSTIPDVTVHGPFAQSMTTWFNFCTNVTDESEQLRKFQPMADRRIRLATASAVNLTEMNLYVNNGMGEIAKNLIPPGTAPEGANNPAIKPSWSFNLTKAAELLVDAMENPITSFKHYNGTPIPAGVVDNRFGDTNDDGRAELFYNVEMYVGAADQVSTRILSEMATNLNKMAPDVDAGGNATGLTFSVVPVPGGQQFILASLHRIYMYWGGWAADYNHVLNWLGPMYLSTGTYFSWNQWNLTNLDVAYLQAAEADRQGDVARLLAANDEMNMIANDMAFYMWLWHPRTFFVRSSFLKGWYYNPTLAGEYLAPMYYSMPVTVDIVPQRLNLKGGGWVKAYIELPSGLSIADIDVSSIRLNGTVPVYSVAQTHVGDYDRDGVPDLVVKFSKSEVIGLILAAIGTTERKVTLTITGDIQGLQFQGNDTVFCYNP